MKGRSIVGIGAALAVMAAGFVGVAAATTGSDGSSQQAERATTRAGWPGRTVASVAAAERLAASSDARPGRTLTVVTHPLHEAEVNIPPKRFSAGDFFIFEEAVFNSSEQRRIGEDAGRCELGIRTFTCEATMLIHGEGKIRVAGSLFGPRDATLPITGGTGQFQTAGGQVTVFDLQGGKSALVFHITR